MIPLHKVPRGLLDLLRARTLGRNPDELGNVVTSIVDATSMYGSDLQVVASDALAAGAINRTITGSATFPGRLLAIGGQIVMGAAAGTFLRLRISYSPGPSFLAVPLIEQTYTAPALVNGSTYTTGILLPSPLVFAPGAQFTFSTIGDAAGADHVPTMRSLFENYAPA
jgi:hypothetical protein